MKILQLSTALPKNAYSTEELTDSFPCKLPEGVTQNILSLGVSKRYFINHAETSPRSETILSEDGLVNLCQEACEGAIEKADLSVKDIGYLIVTYDVNPFLSPGLSQLLVPNLSFNPNIKHVNAQGIASTSFPKALELAEDHLAAHPMDSVLICVSGVSSYWFQNQVHGIADVMEIGKISMIKDEDKRQMELRKWVAIMEFFLFGDGAAAAVVAQKGEGLAVKGIAEVTNIRKKDYTAGYARLAALEEPFKFGFYSHLDKEIPRLGAEYTDMVLKELLGKNTESIMKTAEKWAVHTGSEKILNTLAERHRIEWKKLEESYEVLRQCGNLAGASLPFILERIVLSNRLSVGDIVLMVGYGWGFSAAASLLEYDK